MLGWKLDRTERETLLVRFPPSWPVVIADHITLDAHPRCGDPLPKQTTAKIIGSVDDGDGLQAMVVAIDESTERPDGNIFHITWSLDRERGRKPVDSLATIREHGWSMLDEPVSIHIHPARF